MTATNARPPSLTPAEETAKSEIQNIVNGDRRPRIACLVSKKNKTFSTLSSRFGGSFAWPANKPPPSLAGAFCLVQINCSELPSEAEGLLPKSGLLQVFVANEEIYGRDVESTERANNGDGYLVVFHSLSDNDEFELLDPAPDEECSLPLGVEYGDALQAKKGVPMRFEYQADVSQFPADYRIQKIGLDTCYDNNGNTVCSQDFEKWYDKFQDQLWDEKSSSVPCWLLGHPSFTQEDIRAGTDNKEDWISFMTFTSAEDLFMWGDAGDATILVPSKNLPEMDLSETWYSWDCS